MRRAGVCVAPILALATLAATAMAQAPVARVTLSPGAARLGEPVTYRAEVVGTHVWSATGVQWTIPDSGGAFTWGEPRRGVARGRPVARPRFGARARTSEVRQGTPDTSWIEARLQAFELGVLSVPGLEFRYQALDGNPATGRLPTARLVIMPVLAAADSDATLRSPHGPLAAPWWERVPWKLVAAGLFLLALALVLFLWWRRRRRARRAAAPEPALSPAAQALAALAALRALGLPAQARFAEHAFRLGQILRRYLEATVPTTHPGDSTPELVRHLGEAGLGAEDLGRLAGLLRVWDRVKFAREPFSAEEAARTETAVEGFIRRGAAAGGVAEAA